MSYTQETRVQTRVDDVAGSIRQALHTGAALEVVLVDDGSDRSDATSLLDELEVGWCKLTAVLKPR
jgi:hypothetical protein